MSVREPKSTQAMTIQINGRTSERKGRLELTSGNLYYYRKSTDKPAIRLTYQQVCEMLEKEIEYRDVPTATLLPKGDKSDFWFEAHTGGDSIFDDHEVTAHGKSPLSKMDSRRVDAGQFSMISQDADRRKKKQGWYASISLPLVISILNWYADKFLVGKRKGFAKTKDVTITKPELRQLLLQMMKKLDG
jgi:hypothetical protein